MSFGMIYGFDSVRGPKCYAAAREKHIGNKLVGRLFCVNRGQSRVCLRAKRLEGAEFAREKEYARQDSNLQPSVPKTDALSN